MRQTCPEPVVKRVVCSLCELDWHLHGEDPSTLDCIRLLRNRQFMGRWDPHPYPMWTVNTRREPVYGSTTTPATESRTPRTG